MSMEELRLAEARLRVFGDQDAVAAVVAAAVNVMMSGYDTPNLRVLAGEDRSDAREVDRWLSATLVDLRLQPLDEREAVLLLAESLARRAVIDEASATAVAPAIWLLYARAAWAIEWPTEFIGLAYSADAVEDQPDLPDTVPGLMAAAHSFLEARRG